VGHDWDRRVVDFRPRTLACLYTESHADMLRIQLLILALFLLLVPEPLPARAQTPDPALFQELRWRNIGPFRASRTVGGVGIPTQPNVFYIGVNNGGVWRTDDFGRTWSPIFDEAPTGSVGDVAVSPSDPNVIYVGTGEGLHRPDLGTGDGVFRSVDRGRTWKHIGLEDVQQISRLIVHPSDPDVAFVAGLGHPYGANEERGVFRTRNGGESWERVLYIDHNTGSIQVEFAPGNPQVLFADMWEHREGPWENAAFSGPNSGLYKSTDGGDSWRKVTRGLPGAEQGLGRIGVGFAPSDLTRMYATVDARTGGGIYRSFDSGESWELVSSDRRLWGRGGDFGEIRVRPDNPNVVFVGNVASYRSDDGGETWTSLKGAPGGDDYHRIWINPLHPEIMLFATDQGATVTVNGGRTWSSWYNQPTSQLYHVTADNQFPYWVYGGQQESGAIGIASRGNGGQISFRDWMGVGADEYAYVAPDPLNPDIVYGGRVMRFNKRTGQAQSVAPEAVRSGKYRILRTMPLLFHPSDPRMLLFATNVLWKTTTGGDGWEIISPDLSREHPDVPESIGDFATPDLADMPRRGVIYAVGPSPLDVDLIWAGTDDGLVHVTRDGGLSWSDVTPPGLRAWDKVSQIDAGHFSEGVAYLAVNAIRRDDQRPHIYRTDDFGATWLRIVNGLPEEGPVNVVREDPVRAGLLVAGTERSVYASVNNGDSWFSIRQNLPPSSMRDLVIHGSDIVLGTHGRSIWIMDGIGVLRELAEAEASSVYLFDPGSVVRVRHNMFADTPLPPEEPTGENPPDGAVLDYYLRAGAGSVTIDILDSSGNRIRSYSSDDLPEYADTTAMPHPTYWRRPTVTLSNASGMHRWVWDLRYGPPRGVARSYTIAAVLGNTPTAPAGPLVVPGEYVVRMSADDNPVLERNVVVLRDPRVEADPSDLRAQHAASMRAYELQGSLADMRAGLRMVLARLRDSSGMSGREQRLIQQLQTAGEAIIGRGAPSAPDALYGSFTSEPVGAETLVGTERGLLYLLALFQGADARPTTQAMEGLRYLESAAESIRMRMESLTDDLVPPLNDLRQRRGALPIGG
jgi:photosystem II stability/assembly factor-like uncharacterized protein